MSTVFNLDNMYCGAIHRGDLFVYEKNKEEKIVVVLQDNVLNDGLPTVVGAEVVPYNVKRHTTIFPNEILLKQKVTGLGIDALCMTNKLHTLDRRGMVAKKGDITSEILQEIYQAVDITFGRFRDIE